MKKLFGLLVMLVMLSYSNSYSGWVAVTNLPLSSTANSISVVDANTLWVVCDAGRVFKSVDGGTTWLQRNSGIPSTNLYGVSALDTSNCWVGTGTGAIYRTTDGGNTWTQQIIVSGSFINGIKMVSMTHGFYTGDPTGSGQPYQNRFTTNGGANWLLPSTSVTAGNEFGVINAWDWIDTTRFWIGSANLTPNAITANIYRTNTGYTGSWTATGVTGTGGTAGLYYQAIAFTDANNGMAGSNGSNIVKTTNGGTTWTPVVAPAGLTTFAAINMNGMKDGSNIIRIIVNETVGYRMFMTTNYGTSWTEETLPSSASTNGLQHMQFLNQNLGYAAGNLGTVVKYDGTVGIVGQTGETPDSYKLSQNYPNPFNPSTRISFSIPKAGFVTLKVYDNLGREVSNLVNQNLTTGTYEFEFNGAGLQSGVFFYKLQVNDFVETRKMLLVK